MNNNPNTIYIVGKTPQIVYQLRATIYIKKGLFGKPIAINYDSNTVYIDVEIAKSQLQNFINYLLKNKIINNKKGFDISIIALQVDNKKTEDESIK